MNKSKLVLGVDPGESGALVLVQGTKVLAKTKLPKDEYGMLTVAGLDNFDWMYNITERCDIAVLEYVHALPKIAANSNWKLAQSFSALYMWLKLRFSDVYLVRPKSWQKGVIVEKDFVFKKLKEGEDPETTKRKKDTKLTARKAVERINPHYDFVDRKSTPKGSVPDHNYVDAFLITQYLYKKL